jgi:UDPglucose 6-dehydrogenase
MDEARRRLGERITYAPTNYDALTGADALLVVTDWNEYRRPDFERIHSTLKRPIVIDGRNLYDPDTMATVGFACHSIGRPCVRGQDIAA